MDESENKDLPLDETIVKKEKQNGFFKEFVKFAFLALIIVLPIRMFIAQPFIVSGSSMDPTFKTGDYLIVDQISYKFGEPQRGDVIIFKFPEDTSKFFIKRIVGLPGETVSLNGNTVSIVKTDGSTVSLDEPYVIREKNNNETVELGQQEYFVMGDNREASLDSRTWGPLNKEFIVGKAYIQLLPINNISLHPGESRQK